MDDVIANPWNILGLLWRVLLIAGPIVAIAWALTRDRRVDSDALARARQEIEATDLPIPPPTSPFTGN
jgi:sterol desaturase/sphingolipid hydroxylase (fatty acid hydroxylase superfamily)